MKKFKSITRAIKRGHIKGYFNQHLKRFFFYRLSKRGEWVSFDPYYNRDMNGENLTTHQIESLITKNK